MLSDIALGKPLNGMIEVSGPERFRVNEIVARYLDETNDPRTRYFGTELNDQPLVSDRDAWLSLRSPIVYPIPATARGSARSLSRIGRDMPLKTVIAFIDFSPSGEARTRYAVKLCLRHGAHLIGVYVAPSGLSYDRTESYVRGQDAIRQLIQKAKAEVAAASHAASQTFKAATAHDDICIDFRIIRESDASECAKIHSLHADLVIVGHPNPGGLPYDWSPQDMLLATGVPLLIVPDDWNGNSIAERILLGWNASREARRAIADSLPLLTTAKSVSVVVVDSHKNPRHGEQPGADVALYLSRHGAKVVVEHIQSEGKAVAAIIQMAARRNNTDLLIIGAYSHSRLRQTIFGGVTHALLADVTIPTLIAH